MNFYNHHGAENVNEKNMQDGRLAFGNKYFPAQIKRHTFFHEREVRIVALEESSNQNRLEFDFDWKNIVEEIYLAPKMDKQDVQKYLTAFSSLLNCQAQSSKVYKL